MLKIRLVAVGNKMPKWVEQGYFEYAKRFATDVELSLVEIPAAKRTKNSDLERVCKKEGEAILQACGKGTRIVCLDVEGKPWTTPQLAKQLERWQQDGRTVDLLVGGPEGLAPDCLARSEQRWSLSPLTLPHPMVRVVVAEALFRAWSLNHNHPYHRD